MEVITPAERHYRSHLKSVSNYQKRHPVKMREKVKFYLQNMKNNEPEKYRDYLAKKRKYYLDVVKPRKSKTIQNDN
jgi:hypothetical protein